jgi:hypothetical protein
MEKQMKELVGEITVEGEKISYSDFLKGTSGTGEIYDEWHEEILKTALHSETFWGDVEDILVPLTGQILIEAVQKDDKQIYLELVDAIKKAYSTLRNNYQVRLRKEQEEFESDHEVIIDRDAPDFLSQLDGFLHEISIQGKYIKEFDNQPLGTYRFVIGYKNQEGVNQNESSFS